jgi:hypothetical protein
MEDESLLNVLAAAVTFDQGRECDEIWLDTSAYSIIAVKRICSTLVPHILEDLGGLINFSASHAAINYRVEGDDVRLYFLLPLR